MLVARRMVHKSAEVNIVARSDTAVVRLGGVIREASIGNWLLPLIEDIHVKAVDAHFKEVELDLRTLEYANAALWRCLVHWVKRVCEETLPGYTLRIVSNPQRSWQQVGIPALRAFSFNAAGNERVIVDGDRS